MSSNTYHRNYNKRIRKAIFALLGDKCVRCSFSDERALQVDHVNGDGHIEAVECGRGNSGLLKRVTANPERYQLLCANCNWIKRHENNEHGNHRNGGWRKVVPIAGKIA